MAHRKLFIDDEVDFYDLRGLTKVLNRPVKHPDNPLIVCEHPWEALSAQVYGTVIFDEDDRLFKMWYLACPDRREPHELVVNGNRFKGNANAYAVSEDGIHWQKPDLGLVSFDGSTANNLLPMGRNGTEGIGVIKDDLETDRERRFKAIWWDHDPDSIRVDETGMAITCGPEDGLYVGWSADGIHWQEHAGNPVISCFTDTGQQLVRDPRRGIYVAFGRLGEGGRLIERSESRDFLHWTGPQMVFRPDDMDRLGTQFYGMGVSLYEGLYLGMPWVLAQRIADTRGLGNDCRIHAQLASSRDGVDWRRVGGRQPFLPNGDVGAWDAGIIYTATAPVVLEDRVLIYYYGSSWPHEPGGRPDMPRGIGVATLRRDGFVSLDAGDDEGNFGTVPFTAGEGQEIHLNLDATHGRAYARLCDSQRCEPLPGLEPSDPIHGDHLDTTIRWSKGQMQALAGEKVAARVYAQRAKFYSYWFTA